MPMVELLFLAAAFLAEIIGTIAGFGSSTILLPIALFFFDFPTALVLVAIFHISGNIGRATFFKHGFHRKILVNFGIPSILMTIVGALLVAYIPQDLLKFILGIFLIAFSVFSWRHPDFRFAPTKRNSVIGGAVSGFFAGLIGTGGALRGAFLNSFKFKKEVYIATAAVIALAVDLTRVPIYIFNGFLREEFYTVIPILFLLAIMGSYIGKQLVERISQKSFRKIVLLMIIAVSLKFVYDGLLYALGRM